MKKLDVILRTCSTQSISRLNRICGDDRELMLVKCITSLINSINSANFSINLTVLDDHSSSSFLTLLESILSKCNKTYSLVSLEERGQNSSAYYQFLEAAQGEDLVYTVEDDYLHEPNAISNMLTAYNYLSKRFGKVVLSPYDDPLRYNGFNEEQTLLLHDGARYWRQTSKTTYTLFASSSLFRDNFQVFKTLALNYPRVLEDDTINNLYKTFLKDTGFYWVFNPIPSIAYHLSAATPLTINTGHLTWQDLWNLIKERT